MKVELRKRRDVQRVVQATGHCGPASVAMLLGTLGPHVTQSQIVEAAEISTRISTDGSIIYELASAVSKLEPDFELLAKFNSSLLELAALVEELGIPAGIEWQGRFHSSAGEFEEGHYSIVTSVDLLSGKVHVIDPDDNSVLSPKGEILMSEFSSRWWEENEVIDANGVSQKVLNDRLLFIVAHATEQEFFRGLGFARPTMEMMLQAQRRMKS